MAIGLALRTDDIDLGGAVDTRVLEEGAASSSVKLSGNGVFDFFGAERALLGTDT